MRWLKCGRWRYGRGMGDGAQGAVMGLAGVMVLVYRDEKQRAEKIDGERNADPRPESPHLKPSQVHKPPRPAFPPHDQGQGRARQTQTHGRRFLGSPGFLEDSRPDRAKPIAASY